MFEQRGRVIPILALAVAGCLWGTGFLFGKVALSEMPVPTMVLIASGHREEMAKSWQRDHRRTNPISEMDFRSPSRRWRHDIGSGERRSIGSGPDNGHISFGIGHAQQQPHARPRIDWKPSRTMRGTMISAAAASAHPICQIAFNPMPTRAIHDR